MTPDPLVELSRLEGVPSALAAARDAVAVSRRRRRGPGITPEELAAARRAGADASAELTGDLDRWRTGSWALTLELGPLSRLILVSPLQALARAHLLAAPEGMPAGGRGRIRPGAEVADRMQGLAGLLTRPRDAPAVVLAAIAHAEIVTVAPFGGGDDLVARAVERMVLMATGVDGEGVLPVEAAHLRLAAAYRRGLQDYASGTRAGVRGWLLHCARALQDAAG